MLTRLWFGTHTVAEFIDPDWGHKVNSGVGLANRPARLHGLAGRYDNPVLFPSKGFMNSATVALAHL
jgi:hypothetical protein